MSLVPAVQWIKAQSVIASVGSQSTIQFQAYKDLERALSDSVLRHITATSLDRAGVLLVIDTVTGEGQARVLTGGYTCHTRNPVVWNGVMPVRNGDKVRLRAFGRFEVGDRVEIQCAFEPREASQ